MLYCFLATIALATAAEVSVEYMGSSGGLKLSNADSGLYLQISQTDLQEVDSEGKRVNGNNKKMNLAGGSFADPTTVTGRDGDTNTSVTSAVFTKSADGVDFKLHALFTATESLVFDEVVNDTVTVRADVLKFSMSVEGWRFSDTTSQLQYDIEIKDKSGSETASEKEVSGDKVFSFGDGQIDTPTHANVDGIRKDCLVATSRQGSKNVITFTFPHFENYVRYDPDVTVYGNVGDSVLPSSIVSLTTGLFGIASGLAMFV